MKTRTLIGTALLASAAGLGLALAATEIDHLPLPFQVHADTHPLRVADSDHGREGKADRNGRHNDDDDDDDDDDHVRAGARPAAGPQTGQANPATPVPDNGLFQGKARPKVELQ